MASFLDNPGSESNPKLGRYAGMALRRVGSKVKLTAKALKSRPDLRGEVGTLVYRPITAFPKGYTKRGRIMYHVKFTDGNYPREFGAFADEIQSAK